MAQFLGRKPRGREASWSAKFGLGLAEVCYGFLDRPVGEVITRLKVKNESAIKLWDYNGEWFFKWWRGGPGRGSKIQRKKKSLPGLHIIWACLSFRKGRTHRVGVGVVGMGSREGGAVSTPLGLGTLIHLKMAVFK